MNILLGVSASVACYKACTIASRLVQAGHGVDVVLTAHAAQLISPRLFHAIAGRPAHVDEFDQREAAAMAHIELAERAEVLVIAPATAATISRLSRGAAGDLLGTVELALGPEVPRLVAPAMNPRMYAHPSVRANLEQLRRAGWRELAPQRGWSACGDEGVGRLMEPEEIAARILALEGTGER